MKLKTLVGSMAILGLVSTSAFAAPAGGAKHSRNWNQKEKDFYMSIMNRNQDNNGTLMMNHLRNGESKLTGKIYTEFQHNDRGGENSNGDTGFASGNSTSSIDLSAAELFFDARINSITTAHVSVDYDYNVVGNQAGVPSGSSLSKGFFFSEAAIEFNYGALFVNIGRQYLNFGSTMHNSITAPVTQVLSSSDQDAVTVGAQNFGGFFIDGSVYNGTPVNSNSGTTPPPSLDNSSNNVHGYNVDFGYATLGDGYGFHLYIDYLSNMADVTAVHGSIAPNGGNPYTENDIPAIAAHGDFIVGPFTFMADYVTATKSFDANILSTINNSLSQTGAEGAKPSAWRLEGDYHFIPGQNLTLGVEGTRQAQNVRELGSDFNLPESRFLAAYTIGLNRSQSVQLEGEYTNDKDYSTGTGSDNGGTGNTNNTVTVRLRVGF